MLYQHPIWAFIVIGVLGGIGMLFARRERKERLMREAQERVTREELKRRSTDK